jgi:alanine dehydrogenase
MKSAALIGIRHEDKSRWEARAPVVPPDVRRLIQENGLRFCVQTSPQRAFKDEEYRAAGAEVAGDLSACPIILGVKEIPPKLLEPGKTYMFFSHTIKHQPHNMPMLRRLVELGCTLIDYERIVDERGRRLVFFGRYAGLAGMIDALWALGRRLEWEGLASPFAAVRRAYEYRNLDDAKQHLAEIAQRVRREGLPPALAPLVIGFAGYGHVSAGAQEIWNLFAPREVAPDELGSISPRAQECFKVVFREEHMVERLKPAPAATFDLQDYYDHPENYRSRFFPYVRHLTVLVNGIYWEAKYPRLVTCEQLRELWSGAPPRLRVIADISCDINGSIECTVRATEPGNPVYVYEPATGQTRDGVQGDGPVILAVDILPCELPVDASRHFSEALSPFLAPLARADFTASLERSGLPPELQRATIVYRGHLTEPYRHLESELR